MRNIQIDDIEFTIRGIKYTWCGGYGCIMSSRERWIKAGSTRVIGDTIFYAHSVSYREVSWTVQNCNMEFIREFKSALLGFI